MRVYVMVYCYRGAYVRNILLSGLSLVLLACGGGGGEFEAPEQPAPEELDAIKGCSTPGRALCRPGHGGAADHPGGTRLVPGSG